VAKNQRNFVPCVKNVSRVAVLAESYVKVAEDTQMEMKRVMDIVVIAPHPHIREERSDERMWEIINPPHIKKNYFVYLCLFHPLWVVASLLPKGVEPLWPHILSAYQFPYGIHIITHSPHKHQKCPYDLLTLGAIICQERNNIIVVNGRIDTPRCM
jgi:hypothetical protein